MWIPALSTRDSTHSSSSQTRGSGMAAVLHGSAGLRGSQGSPTTHCCLWQTHQRGFGARASGGEGNGGEHSGQREKQEDFEQGVLYTSTFDRVSSFHLWSKKKENQNSKPVNTQSILGFQNEFVQRESKCAESACGVLRI